LNLSAEDKKNRDLIIAIANGNVELVIELIDAGADINYKYHRSIDSISIVSTPFSVAIEKGNLILVKLLLACGASLESDMDDAESTPIQDAAAFGHLEIVKYLIEKGAKINATNFYNVTALLAAVNNNRVEVTNYLLEHGANFTICNSEGKTALMYAKEKGYTEIIKLLEAVGAS
jgi:ankyrin repeat protein